ncbi:MAG: hypothetical protein NT009_09875 [Proteobacteria bacterium]|nr:hypothetical protein [Pseudomonadota bacterium]
MRKNKSAPKQINIPPQPAEIHVNPPPDDFRERLLQAIREDNPREIYVLALREARKLDREGIFWIMRHLAQIAEPEFTDWENEGTRSASITRVGSRYTIRFNPGFLNQFVHEPGDLLFLVLHEVLHKVRGDLRRPGFELGEDPLDKIVDMLINNIAADLLVNASLVRQFFPTPPRMLERLYRDRDLWLSFLLPPRFATGLGSNLPDQCPEVRKFLRVPLLRFQPEEDEKFHRSLEKVVALYVDGWSRSSSMEILVANLTELFYELEMERSHSLRVYEILKNLLGGHLDPTSTPDSPWWEWFRNEFAKHFKGAGRSGGLDEEKTEPDEIYAWEFYEAMRRALSADPKNPAFNVALLPEVGVVPFWGRKEIFLYRGGYRPVFCPNPITRRDWVEHKVQLYIDVSGSTEDYWPFLYGLALHLRDEIGEPFYCFSNQVEAIGLKELREGNIRTTGGTDFDCVFNHAYEHRFRRILVVTDGYADLREEVRKRNHLEVFAVLTMDNTESILVDVAGRDRKGEKWWVIDWEKIKQSLCI